MKEINTKLFRNQYQLIYLRLAGENKKKESHKNEKNTQRTHSYKIHMIREHTTG